MPEITASTLTFRDRAADVNYYVDVPLFLPATSGEQSLTAAFFLRQFLAFSLFKYYLGSFSSCKTAFLANIMPPKHAEQDHIDVKRLEKKKSDVRVKSR